MPIFPYPISIIPVLIGASILIAPFASSKNTLFETNIGRRIAYLKGKYFRLKYIDLKFISFKNFSIYFIINILLFDIINDDSKYI